MSRFTVALPSQWTLQITSGMGPAPVRRFVLKLAALLSDELEQLGQTTSATVVFGDPEEPRAVQLHFDGAEPKVPCGTYVLVDRAPERGKKSRKRWFASVEVYQSVQSTPWLDEKTIEFSTCRSGGPGGQHVNKTESAVRAVHVPTGISVRVTSERSQLRNRETAVTLIKKALQEQRSLKQADQIKERRGQHYLVQRGHAVRTFVMNGQGRLTEQKVGL